MNILFVDNHSKNPFDVQFGSIQRTNLFIQACANVGHVDLILFNNEKVESNIKNCDVIHCKDVTHTQPSKISEFWRKFKNLIFDKDYFFGAINREKEKIVDDIISKGNYDFIVTRYIPCAVNCGLPKYGKRLLIDVDDSPVSIKRNVLGVGATVFHKWYHQLMFNKAERLQTNLLERIGCGFFSNIDDVVPNVSVHLPNIPFYSKETEYCDFSKTPNNILFVGFVNFSPNLYGLNHFFGKIYPLVKKQIPDVTVTIVGKCDKSELPDWKDDPSVHVKGFVDDLFAEYEKSKVAIVPIYTGAGTNIKVLEAFIMKRPCVTTIEGARGYSSIFNENEDYLVCKSDEEFKNSIVRMIISERDNHNVCFGSFSKVKSNYSKSAFFNIVKKYLINIQ